MRPTIEFETQAITCISLAEPAAFNDRLGHQPFLERLVIEQGKEIKGSLLGKLRKQGKLVGKISSGGASFVHKW
jgi:hypothetical protein